ncbi:MAG: hypothetical protein HWE08_13460 [Alphaproteobacteria bacterium]|nr:hypothetical protein [Alphaproteobacteria bacterium]
MRFGYAALLGIGLFILSFMGASATAQATKADDILEDTIYDAYMIGPSVYKALRLRIHEMEPGKLIGILLDNDRRITSTKPKNRDDPGQLIIEKMMPDGSYQHIASMLLFVTEKNRLLPHEIYNRKGLEKAIEELIQEYIPVPTAPGTATILADIFIKGPEEGAKIASAMRTGRIKHRYGNSVALDWMLEISRFSKNYTDAGTAAAWLLDPAFHMLRTSELNPNLTRRDELATAQRILTLLQGQEAVKRRDLLYCLLKQNTEHPDPERLRELKYIILSRMAEWGEPYPRAELETISDQLGFFRRKLISFQNRDNEMPVSAEDLPKQEIDFSQCPFLASNSFR